MDVVPSDEAEQYEPEKGWRRLSLAGSESFSFEWFEKPPGHASPDHSHENEQVCLVLKGELTVITKDREANLGQHDSVYLEPNEVHRIVNESDDTAIGLDVFAPGRSFDFWTDR